MKNSFKRIVHLVKSFWQKLVRKDDDMFDNPHLIF